ncbi:MAG: glycosyltransferase [Polyangiaceae bacterium]
MRVAIHAGTLRGAGSRAVGSALVRELSRLETPHRFIAFVPGEWPLESSVVAKMMVLKTRPGLARKFALENLVLPRALRAARCDALLSLGDTSSLSPQRPHLLFVQQAFLAYRERDWGFSPRPRMRARMRMMAAYFQAGLPRVDRIVVQTEDMRLHLSERWRLGADRVHVIPSAVGGDVLARNASEPPPRSPTRLVSVTSAGPHKNIELFPALLAALPPRHDAVRLTLTLTRSDAPALVAEAERLGVADRIDFVGAVTRADVIQLLQGAAIAVSPSHLESFGIGYYEALALGTPQVVADLGFAREACGDAARYADADAPEEFAARVTELLDSEQARRESSLAARKRFEAIHVPWTEIARRYLRHLEAIA